MLVGRWVAAVLGEWGQHDQGVGRVDGRVRADAGGAHGLGDFGVLVGRWVAAVLWRSGQDDQSVGRSTGACVQTLKGHRSGVWSVCCRADGSRLFSGSGDRDDQGVGRVDGRVRADAGGAHGWRYSVCLSGDGSRLFSGSWDKTIKVWDVSTGACVQTLEGHSCSVFRCACRPRWVAAVLGECGQDDQGVGRVDGRVRADAGGAQQVA